MGEDALPALMRLMRPTVARYRRPIRMRNMNRAIIHQPVPMNGSLSEKPKAPAGLPQVRKK